MRHPRHKFEKIAEDNNSPFFRNWLFCKGTSQYIKILDIQGPTMAVLSRQNYIEYFTLMETWIQSHEAFKQRAHENYKFVEELIDLADKHGNRLNRWTQNNIFQAPLHKYSRTKLWQLYEKYLEIASLEYTYGVAMPILDFQGFSLVENSIISFLKSKVPADKYPHYLKIFTEPIRNSFSQEQDENLLNIMKDYVSQPAWRKTVLERGLDDVIIKYPKFYSQLKKHTARFAWVYFVYMGPAFTEENFLDFVRDFLRKKVDPKALLQKFKQKRIRNNQLKVRYLKQLRPDAFNKSMLQLAGKMVWAKPRRKDYQSKSYYHVEKLQKEIAKRLFISLEQVRNTLPQLLKQALLHHKTIDKIANQILGQHICVKSGEGRVSVLWGKRATDFLREKIVQAKAIKVASRLKSLSGQIAFSGKAIGRARIVNKPQEMSKMGEGDILISAATTPSIVPAMKKAAAIVTDEGGLTCHASIVSRELETPCIVGTKIATKLLKDGMMVEVDANLGVVKIIK